MFIASRRIFPPTDSAVPQQMVLEISDEWTNLEPEVACLLRTTTDNPPNQGSYRKYRLRCSYSDSVPGLQKPELQFKLMPGHQLSSSPSLSRLTPEILSVPRASTIDTMAYSSVTSWFTVGQGSVTDLQDLLDASAVVAARYTNASSNLNLSAVLYELVLECWDFTSPQVTSSVAIIHDNELWTRLLCRGPNAMPLLVDSATPSNSLYLHDFSSMADPSVFPAAGSDTARVFRMRGMIATKTAQTIVKVDLHQSNDTFVTSWTLQGFDSIVVQQRTVLSGSQQDWQPPADLDLSESIIKLSCFTEKTYEPTACWIYDLALEVHERRTSTSSPALRSIKSINRSLKLGVPTITVPADGSSVEVGRFRELFTHGAAILDADSARDFSVSMTMLHESWLAAGDALVLKATDLNNRKKVQSIRLPLSSKTYAADNNWYEDFTVSNPFTFGDGRTRSIPSTDWLIELSFETKSERTEQLQVTSLVLEGRDRPMVDLHLPPSQVTGIALLTQTITLPKSAYLSPLGDPFTISLWVYHTSTYYEENDIDNTEGSLHTIISMEQGYSLSIRGDGALCAQVQDVNDTETDSQTRNAVYQREVGLQVAEWHYITFIWTGFAIQLAVDGTFQEETTATYSRLLPGSGFPVLGSPSFAGRIRNVTFWNTALTVDAVRSAMFTPVGSPPDLIASIEFTSMTPVINAPKAPELKGFQLPPEVSIYIESNGLVITEGGCVLVGKDGILHQTGQSGYTLEAWIAPMAIPTNTVVIAGEFYSLSQGYGLQMQGQYIISVWGNAVLRSKGQIAVDEINSHWTHVATTFDPAADPPTLSLYIDGALDSTLSLDISTSVDNESTDFVIGAFCQDAEPDAIPVNCFVGYMDDIRLWNVCRGEMEIRVLMYGSPAVDAPGLTANWTFEADADNVSSPTLSGNAEIITYSRPLVEASPPQLLTIAAYQQPGYKPLPPRVSDLMLRPTPPVNALGLPIRPAVEVEIDPELALIWINFVLQLICIILEAVLAIDLEGEEIREVVILLWETESIRLIITGLVTLFQNLPQSDPPATEPSVLTESLMSRPALNRPLVASEIDTSSAVDVSHQIIALLFEIARQGLLLSLLRSLPALSWKSRLWMMAQVVPGVGEVIIAANVVITLGRIYFAIRALLDALEEYEKKKTPQLPAALLVTFDGAPIILSNSDPVPLRVGGASQTIYVALVPPSTNGSVSVFIEPSDPLSILVSGNILVFPEGDSSPQPVAITCVKPPTTKQRPYLYVWTSLGARAGAAKVNLDPREQRLIMDPDSVSLSMDVEDDKITLDVSFYAILDPSTDPVIVSFSDVTDKDDDPDSSKMLDFEPERMIFLREGNQTHNTTPQKLTISLKDRPPEEAEVVGGAVPAPMVVTRSKRKLAQAQDNNNNVKRAKVAVVATHITNITMIQAGKGDCYVISDQQGNAAVAKTMLVDGGVAGTWARLHDVLTALNIDVLDAVQCTHYDSDHVSGLIEMVADQAHCLNMSNFLFNDPDGNITDLLPNLNPLAPPVLALSRLAISPAKPVPPAESNQPLALNPVPPSARLIDHSKRQGRRLYDLLAQWNTLHVVNNRPAITLLAPWGNGEAIPQPSINQFDLFPALNTTFYGPSIANITAMRQSGARGVQANRVSTVTVFSTKNSTDAFTGLFTGDAHDTILHRDIRGDLTAPQHFSIMKVPHHGSKHSESQEFYYQYTADVYLISSRFSTHGLPSLRIMKALLWGCRNRGTKPIIITTSVYETSGIDQMVGPLTQDLLSTGAKMYFFKDGMNSMNSITLTWKNGVLETNVAQLGMTVKP
ncbi:uncharacterized protein CDV56_105546 [Aspergillus thermomutatus]|uniref:LamG-like jellyroll fold domain-containing protein n=1 Tax=Aspergillus thermomutatus TaxID=41047 RepID=A0A397HN79_ASPTH|nr:uncharacterized protein CDV56_105546 [Aspergillus thermomutatus]RHZ63056.1 hypothetical protein CDV56_105546 [Aspergillus thermomutatus]